MSSGSLVNEETCCCRSLAEAVGKEREKMREKAILRGFPLECEFLESCPISTCSLLCGFPGPVMPNQQAMMSGQGQCFTAGSLKPTNLNEQDPGQLEPGVHTLPGTETEIGPVLYEKDSEDTGSVNRPRQAPPWEGKSRWWGRLRAEKVVSDFLDACFTMAPTHPSD